MYLSRITLKPSIMQASQLGHLLKDRSYGMHRLLWDLFDNNERFLFREESQKEQLGKPGNMPLYYVFSNEKPDPESVIFSVETKPFEPSLNTGDVLMFRLRANPTVARVVTDRKKSVRHDVAMDAQYHWLHQSCEERNISPEGKKSQLKAALLQHNDFSGPEGRKRLDDQLKQEIELATKNWLVDRGATYGFEVDSSKLQATAYRWNALPEKHRKAGFSSIDYEGLLSVLDAGKFIKMLHEGLGPSKAFGCGLMLIKRA